MGKRMIGLIMSAPNFNIQFIEPLLLSQRGHPKRNQKKHRTWTPA
jgi:hypothetical protein